MPVREPLACVFGGTGFLGQRVVRHFADQGSHVRVISRNPDKVSLSGVSDNCLERIAVDVRDEKAVAAAVAGAHIVVNAISLYIEQRGLSFYQIHTEAAGRVARLSRLAGVESLAYVSGIGADRSSPSELVRAKAFGEEIVATEFPGARIVRPSVMFGPYDAFISNLEMATSVPVVPLFGSGEVKAQPAWVEDVAQAIVLWSKGSTRGGQALEFGGAETLSYREATEAVCEALDRRRLLLPLPINVWKVLISVMKLLPKPPLTIDQLHLLVQDNTVHPERDGFSALNMQPRGLRDLLRHCLVHDHKLD